MSLLGALTPDEMAERCFPRGALLKALIEKKKYVDMGLGMAEGWETLTHAKARRVCHINNVSGHKYFKIMMMKSQNCTLLDYCYFYLCNSYTK